MKKLILKIFLLAVSLSILLSCSSDDSGSTTSGNVVLIKKIKEVLIADEMELTINFNYQNNVLMSTTEGNYKTEFTYNGGKVVLIKNFNNNVPVSQTTIAYNGDLLDYTLSGDDADEKTQYHYTNGILSKIESGYIGNNNQFVVLQTEEFLFSGTNITEISTFGNFGGTPFSYKNKYSYDNKNCPAKFMNKYLKLLISSAGFKGINQNNFLSEQTFSPVDSTTPSTQTFEIVYNDNDFPTEIKEYSANNTLRTITTIEYQ